MDPTPENPEQKVQLGYGIEILCACWTPLAMAVAEPVAACHEFVAEVATADAEAFLASFYRFQQG